jgi:hypothetical protein
MVPIISTAGVPGSLKFVTLYIPVHVTCVIYICGSRVCVFDNCQELGLQVNGSFMLCFPQTYWPCVTY